MLRIFLFFLATLLLGQAAEHGSALASDAPSFDFADVRAAAATGSVRQMKALLGKRFPVGAHLKNRHRWTKQYIDYRLLTEDGFPFLVRFPLGHAIPKELSEDALELVDFEPYSTELRLGWYPVFSFAPAH